MPVIFGLNFISAIFLFLSRFSLQVRWRPSCRHLSRSQNGSNECWKFPSLICKKRTGRIMERIKELRTKSIENFCTAFAVLPKYIYTFDISTLAKVIIRFPNCCRCCSFVFQQNVRTNCVSHLDVVWAEGGIRLCMCSTEEKKRFSVYHQLYNTFIWAPSTHSLMFCSKF